MLRNRLKQVIQKKVDKVNAKKAPREAKLWPHQELQALANALSVSFSTAKNWYRNVYQPKGDNFYRLPEHYKVKWEKFYYKKVIIKSRNVNKESLAK